MEKLKNIVVKYKEMILYVFFGILTTLCNFISYYIFAHILSFGELSSTAIAFVISVIFAFFTNRKYVFASSSKGFKEVSNELLKFFGSRLFSGGIDFLIMYIFAVIIMFNDMLIKILSNILVVILNYIFSKLFVFKKK